MIKLKNLFDSLLLSQTSENSDLLPLLLVWELWGLGRVPLLSLHDLLSQKTEAALNGRDINTRMEILCNTNLVLNNGSRICLRSFIFDAEKVIEDTYLRY